MKKILVIGATGPQGRPVAQKLLAAGYHVRAVVRDATRAKDLAQMGVDIVEGDLSNPASVSNAVKGQDGIFMLISFFAGNDEQAKTVIDAAVAHNVKKIVWNATGPILPFDTGNPSIDIRRPILAALENSGIAYVALQPTVYMENFLIPAIAQEVAEKNVLAYPMPDSVLCQWITHQDAAAYVVAAFDSGSQKSMAIEICGPEKLNGSEIAERFGKALGRKISFRPMPPEEFARAISYDGNEEAIISYYRSIFENPAIMTTNVDHQHALKALPISPMSIEDFARLYAGALTAGSTR